MRPWSDTRLATVIVTLFSDLAAGCPGQSFVPATACVLVGSTQPAEKSEVFARRMCAAPRAAASTPLMASAQARLRQPSLPRSGVFVSRLGGPVRRRFFR